MQHNKIRMIEGATRTDSGRPLCATCANGVVMKGAAESCEKTYCQKIGEYVHIFIADCSGYHNRSSVSLRKLEESAWILSTRSAGRQIGFMRYDQWRKQNKYEEVIPSDD